MRKPSGRLPVDRAKDRPESPNPQNGISTEGLYVPPPSPVQQFDAVRAVEFQRQQGVIDFAGAAEVLFALGLAQPAGLTEANPAVPKDFDCPTCDAVKGQGCLSGDGRYMRFHVARIRLAQKAITPRRRAPSMAEQKGLRAALRERLAEKLHDVTGLVAGDVLIFEDCLTLADEILTGTQIDVARWCDFHEGRPAECPPDDTDQCEKETWTYVAIPPEVFALPAGESTPEVTE